MKTGWEINTWSDVLEIRSGRNQKEVANPSGKYPILGSAGKVMGYADKYICEEGTTIIGRKGTINSPMFIETRFWNVDTAFGLHALENLDKCFLYYFCQSFDFTELDKGSGRPSLVKSDLLKVKMPVPTLEEQRKIVAVLDQAFAAIDQAKANIEKNLQNAKELFQSKLNEIFTQKGEGWEEKKLGDIVNIKTGKLNANAMVEGGEYPFFTCSREIFSIDIYAFDCEAILLAGNNASGDFNVKHYEGKFNAYQRTYVITSKEKGVVHYSYLKHKLISHLKSLKEQSLGANTKFLKIGMIRDISLQLPSYSLQEEVVQQLDGLYKEIEQVEVQYWKKTDDLDELKKSVLQKAFAGELEV